MHVICACGGVSASQIVVVGEEGKGGWGEGERARGGFSRWRRLNLTCMGQAH